MKRVVTTNDGNGRSRILIEEAVDAHSLIWETLPGEPLGRDPVPADHDLVFPKGRTSGAVCGDSSRRLAGGIYAARRPGS